MRKKMHPEISLCVLLMLCGTISAKTYPQVHRNPNEIGLDAIDEIKINVNIPKDAYRRKRSTNDFPDDMDIDLPVDGSHMTLSLHRNFHITNRVPVTVQRNGKIFYETLRDPQEVVYYYDKNNGSVFMVQRDTNPDSDDEFDFFGIFHRNSRSYLIQPPDTKHKSHSVSKVQEGKPVTSDYIIPSETEGFKRKVIQRKKGTNSGRYKRQTTLYEVEILMVADFAVFSYWKTKANGTTTTELENNAKALLRQYYAFLLSAIDLRYMSVTGSFKIQLLFAGLHIAETAIDAPWTENNKDMAFTPVRVNADNALNDFRTWMNDPASGGLLVDHDHAMLFTLYDLELNGDNSVIGLARRGGLCSSNQQSLIEDTNHATAAWTAAHEMGHNLGAAHDGTGNLCRTNTDFVMESSLHITGDVAKTLRLWEFSNCSVEYFSTYIDFLNNQFAKNCMTFRSPNFNATALDEYANQLAGQVYPPDAQCEAFDGIGTYMCREFLNFDYSTICTLMYCSVPVNNGSCFRRIPYEGTSCGNGKICEKGFCVDSAVAPTGLTETCLFDDQPQTVANEGLTCAELIAADQKNCYNNDEKCCVTCGAVAELYTNLIDCQYGNKVNDCGTFAGSICYVSANTVDVCCELCQNAYTGITDCLYGDKVNDCGTFAGSICYVSDNIRDLCCEFCQNAYTGIEDCEYGDKETFCSTLSASGCYSNNVDCCQRCTQFETGIAGCEYGDRESWCYAADCQSYDTQTKTNTCCGSCAITTTTSTTSTTTTSTTTTTPTTTTPTTTTLTTIPETYDSTTRRINIVIVFFVNTIFINFNDPIVIRQTIDDLEIQLTIYYRRRSPRRFRRIRIFRIWEGSLNVNYTVEFDNSTEAAAEATSATVDLRKGLETVEVLNETVSVAGLIVDGNTISSSPTDEDVCQIFTSTIDGCPADYECNVKESSPTCQPIPEKANLPLIIGVGVGIPVCLLMLVLIIVVLWQRRRAKSRSFDHAQQQFPPMTPYNDMNGWREQALDIPVPFEYSSSRASEDTPPKRKHSRKANKYESLYDRHIGSYVYDNRGAEFSDIDEDNIGLLEIPTEIDMYTNHQGIQDTEA